MLRKWWRSRLLNQYSMATKRIGDNGAGAAWNNELITQLRFIREHLRYPISRRTAWPALTVGATLPALAFVLYHVFIADATRRHLWVIPVLIVSMLTPAIVSGRRYLQTLRFIEVSTARTLAKNMALLQSFLRSNNFAYDRHPEAPEVFRIISKSIGALRDEREVVVFIADERRILINSHFTRSRFNAAVGSPRYWEVAKLLRDWMAQQEDNLPHGQLLRPF